MNYIHVIGGFGTILDMSCDHWDGIEPLIWTKEVNLPTVRDELVESKTICSVSTSLATSPFNNSNELQIRNKKMKD